MLPIFCILSELRFAIATYVEVCFEHRVLPCFGGASQLIFAVRTLHHNNQMKYDAVSI